MEKPVIEARPNHEARASFKNKAWKRYTEEGDYGPVPRWRCVSSGNEALSSPKFHRLWRTITNRATSSPKYIAFHAWVRLLPRTPSSRPQSA